MLPWQLIVVLFIFSYLGSLWFYSTFLVLNIGDLVVAVKNGLIGSWKTLKRIEFAFFVTNRCSRRKFNFLMKDEQWDRKDAKQTS